MSKYFKEPTFLLQSDFLEELIVRKLNHYGLADSKIVMRGFQRCGTEADLILSKESFPIITTNTHITASTNEINDERFPARLEAQTIKEGEFISSNHGLLRIFNTITDFELADYDHSLVTMIDSMWNSIVNGDALKCPDILLPFAFFCYSDLKNVLYYRACQPAINIDIVIDSIEYSSEINSCLLRSAHHLVETGSHTSAFFCMVPLDQYGTPTRTISTQECDQKWAAVSIREGFTTFRFYNLYFGFIEPHTGCRCTDRPSPSSSSTFTSTMESDEQQKDQGQEVTQKNEQISASLKNYLVCLAYHLSRKYDTLNSPTYIGREIEALSLEEDDSQIESPTCKPEYITAHIFICRCSLNRSGVRVMRHSDTSRILTVRLPYYPREAAAVNLISISGWDPVTGKLFSDDFYRWEDSTNVGSDISNSIGIGTTDLSYNNGSSSSSSSSSSSKSKSKSMQGDGTSQSAQMEASAIDMDIPLPMSMKEPKEHNIRLHQSLTDFNTLLMRWQNWPGLPVDTLSNLNVVIFGAGCLGCAVSRLLVSYGVRNIVFVDNARVQLSNVTRQSLYELDDALQSRLKAPTAAAALNRLIVSSSSKTHTDGPITGTTNDGPVKSEILTLPIPGHGVEYGEENRLSQSLLTVERLIQKAHVVFPLLDSKEVRWLPTLMAAYHDTLCITAALSFDSYVVMSHGRRKKPEVQPNYSSLSVDWIGSTDEREYQKGCYFCSDVTIPHNDNLHNLISGSSPRSIYNTIGSDTPLDRKCTATRPGLAYIASGMAVELLITIISERNGSIGNRKSSSNSHSHRNSSGIKHSTPQPLLRSLDSHDEPGRYNASTSSTNLNTFNVPHQIRGTCFHQKQHYLTRYNYCVACSDHVLHAMAASEQESESLIYHEFYRSVFSIAGPHILMEISGSMKDAAAADGMMHDVMPLDGLGMDDVTTRDAADEANFEF